MLIERTSKEVIIRLSATVNTDDLQDFLNYARYKKLTSRYKVTPKEVDNLTEEVNEKWWAKNRKRFNK